MENDAPEKLDVITQGHTVGLRLEPGSSGAQSVFFLVVLGFCVQIL